MPPAAPSAPLPLPAEEPRPGKLLSERAWDEEHERIVEREWFDRKSPPRERERERMTIPMPPAPPSRPKIVEKERVIVLRE